MQRREEEERKKDGEKQKKEGMLARVGEKKKKRRIVINNTIIHTLHKKAHQSSGNLMKSVRFGFRRFKKIQTGSHSGRQVFLPISII
ncbi:unnamed protein product [Prunus armeniaca]|uniref:Uncharacterized protein n=1 Tax=Prunus armeniaca TaxID=36596 RepID=A0A6J5XN47_PRUAR|nr:unnamed protein product [Prunus armeniaca]